MGGLIWRNCAGPIGGTVHSVAGRPGSGQAAHAARPCLPAGPAMRQAMTPRTGTAHQRAWILGYGTAASSRRATGGDPGRTRTCCLKFRKLALYPDELRGHASAKIGNPGGNTTGFPVRANQPVRGRRDSGTNRRNRAGKPKGRPEAAFSVAQHADAFAASGLIRLERAKGFEPSTPTLARLLSAVSWRFLLSLYVHNLLISRRFLCRSIAADSPTFQFWWTPCGHHDSMVSTTAPENGHVQPLAEAHQARR